MPTLDDQAIIPVPHGPPAVVEDDRALVRLHPRAAAVVPIAHGLAFVLCLDVRPTTRLLELVERAMRGREEKPAKEPGETETEATLTRQT